jgi:hypothetical protein
MGEHQHGADEEDDEMSTTVNKAEHMKLYVAPAVIVDKDFGSYLGTRSGIWWTDEEGTPGKSGWERDVTVQEIRDRVTNAAQKHGVQVELIEMPKVTRVFDHNPHGSM